jgi:fructosamine-3-kinase
LEETINILKNITSNKLGVIKTATKLQGGIVNQTYKVVTEKGEFVVRINNIDQINVFKKEMYCYDVAKKSGIPSPEVIDLYEDAKQCYLITKYIPGFSNKDIEKRKRTHVWRNLGEYSKLISQVKELPYGEDAQDSKNAKLQYSRGMLDYAIREFAKKDDYFLVNNIFNQGEVAQLLESLNNLNGEIEHIDFGLVHGDLSLANVVRDEKDTVYLIDWGSSNLSTYSGISSHGDLLGINFERKF